MGLKGEDAQIWATDTADSTSMTGESMSDTGDGVTYRIDDSAKDVFDPGVSFTVSDSNGTVSASTYTIEYNVGVVVFDSSPTDPVTIDGSYLPQHTVAKGFETDISVDPGLLDVTRFQDTAPRQITGVKSLEASFGTYQVEEQNIDSGGDNDGPSLDDIALGSGTTNFDFVFRFEPGNSRNTVVAAWVQFDEAERAAGSGDAQTRTFSMAVDQKDSTMSSQPPAGLNIFDE